MSWFADRLKAAIEKENAEGVDQSAREIRAKFDRLAKYDRALGALIFIIRFGLLVVACIGLRRIGMDRPWEAMGTAACFYRRASPSLRRRRRLRAEARRSGLQVALARGARARRRRDHRQGRELPCTGDRRARAGDHRSGSYSPKLYKGVACGGVDGGRNPVATISCPSGIGTAPPQGVD